MQINEKDAQKNKQQEKITCVDVYIRNSQKKANIINISRNISVQQLRRIVSEKVNILKQKLLLFSKGRQLKDNQHIVVEQKNIFHFVNIDNVGKETMQIHINKLHGNHEIRTFKVLSKSNIKRFIDQELFHAFNKNSHDIFLVYTGKPLNSRHTFQEQFVQDQAQLLCLDFQHQKIERRFVTQTIKQRNQQFDTTGINLGPGRPSTVNFLKKQKQNTGAAAPVNIIIKQNNPKQIINIMDEINEQKSGNNQQNNMQP